MPDAWANDAARRAKAGVPETVTFKTKPQIALDQIKWACEAGLPKGVALIDAGYGGEAKFRTGISALDLRYVAGIKSTTNVWAPGTDASCRRRASGTMPPPVYRGRGRGRRAVRPVRDDAHKPFGVEQLALSLPKSSWRKITWREGSNALMSGRFARVRVRSAHDRDAATQTIPEEWLLIEWPDDEKAPTKFWLSTLDETVTFAHLVHMTKLRWRIERDYLELKQEIGLGHFEGRRWRGFHHHATLCIGAYGSWSQKGPLFPPRKRVAARLSKCLPFPKITARGALPTRTERHVPYSIATLRRELNEGLVATLLRCPCCNQQAAAISSKRYRP